MKNIPLLLSAEKSRVSNYYYHHQCSKLHICRELIWVITSWDEEISHCWNRWCNAASSHLYYKFAVLNIRWGTPTLLIYSFGENAYWCLNCLWCNTLPGRLSSVQESSTYTECSLSHFEIAFDSARSALLFFIFILWDWTRTPSNYYKNLSKMGCRNTNFTLGLRWYIFNTFHLVKP